MTDCGTKLRAFFDAENRRDWTAYRTFLSERVVWECHASGQVKTVRGADNYLAAMKAVYEQCDNRFEVEQLYASAQGNRIVTILRNNLGELSCDVFDFEDGLIVREIEFVLD